MVVFLQLNNTLKWLITIFTKPNYLSKDSWAYQTKTKEKKSQRFPFIKMQLQKKALGNLELGYVSLLNSDVCCMQYDVEILTLESQTNLIHVETNPAVFI